MDNRTLSRGQQRRAGGRLAAIAATVCAAAIAVPATAEAGTVTKVSTGGPNGVFTGLVFTAAPGENNDVSAGQAAGGKIRFEDAIAISSYPSGTCQPVAPLDPNKPGAVLCDAAGIDGLQVIAGNGRNKVTVTGWLPAYVTGAGATRNEFKGGMGRDTMIGGDANDLLSGFGGTDTLEGGAGHDILRGEEGADLLIGYSGSDLLDGGAGGDTLRGGTGSDTASYAMRAHDVQISLDGVANDGKDGEGDNVEASVENLSGGSGDDKLSAGTGFVANTLSGGEGDDTLFGGFGPDSIHGGAGNDKLSGGMGKDKLYADAGSDDLSGGPDGDLMSAGLGADLLRGGPGPDYLAGGEGEDTVSYASAPAAVTVDNDGAKSDDGGEGEGDSVQADVEELIGSPFADTLTGNAEPNNIWGRGGGDRIDGGPGHDQLLGEAGDDAVLSADGVGDNVDCGAGRDKAEADAIDTLAACETDQPSGGGGQQGSNPGPGTAGALRIGPARVRLTRRGVARLRVVCLAGSEQGCSGAVRMRRRIAGRLRTVGRHRFELAPGARKIVRIRVGRALRRRLTDSGMRVRVVARPSSGAPAGPLAVRSIRILPAKDR